MVTGTRRELLVAQMIAGNFSIISGVKASLGGLDEGPNPHELLEASLAGCTIITVQMYADRKGYKLESTDVVIKIIEEGSNIKFLREISFRGDLTAEEKARLVEIADRCPIHKLLLGQISIQTNLKV